MGCGFCRPLDHDVPTSKSYTLYGGPSGQMLVLMPFGPGPSVQWPQPLQVLNPQLARPAQLAPQGLEFAFDWRPSPWVAKDGVPAGCLSILPGFAKWEPKYAPWFNGVLLRDSAHFFSGREEVLFAGLPVSALSSPPGALTGCILTSVGRLLILAPPRKSPPLLASCHVFDMEKVIATADKGNYSVSIALGNYFLQGPATHHQHTRETTVQLVLTRQQAASLLPALSALCLALRGTVLPMEAPENLGAVPSMPKPPTDGGFFAAFFAACNYFGLELCELELPGTLFSGLTMLDLALKPPPALRTPAKSIPEQLAAALRMAFFRSGRLKGALLPSPWPLSPQGMQAFRELLPIFANGGLLKLHLPGANLQQNMVVALLQSLAESGANTVVDIDLSSNPVGSPEAYVALTALLAATPGGMRRVELNRCSITASATDALQAIAQRSSKLERLGLAGNAIGRLPSPHPLRGIWRSPKLKSLDFTGTGMELEALLEGAEGRVGMLEEFKVDGCVSPQGPGAVDMFARLGSVKGLMLSLGSPEVVAALVAARAKSSPNSALCDLSNSADGVAGLTLAATAGTLCSGVVLRGPADPSVGFQRYNDIEPRLAGLLAAKSANRPPAAAGALGALGTALVGLLVGKSQLGAEALNLASGLPFAGAWQALGAALQKDEVLKTLVVAGSIEMPSQQPVHITVSLQNKDTVACTVPVQLPEAVHGTGPALAFFLPGLAKNTGLQELDISNNLGGDCVGLQLGSVVLKENRTLRSLKVQGNFISHHGLATIRIALKGNKKLVEFPFPEKDAKALLAAYQQRTKELETAVLQCKSAIKSAYRRTRGARTAEVMRVQQHEVCKITDFKTQMARFKLVVQKYAKEQAEIQQLIMRNQQETKNVERAAKSDATNQKQSWQAAAQAMHVEVRLQARKDSREESDRAEIWGRRAKMAETWMSKAAALRTAKKQAGWLEAWLEANRKEGGVVVTADAAERLLLIVPQEAASSVKAEVSATRDFIKAERDQLAQRELLDCEIERQRLMVQRLQQQPDWKPPPSGALPKLEAERLRQLQQAPGLAVAVPPPSLVKPNVASQARVRPTAAQTASQYEQFRLYQLQQEQQRCFYARRRGYDTSSNYYYYDSYDYGLDSYFLASYCYSQSRWGPDYGDHWYYHSCESGCYHPWNDRSPVYYEPSAGHDCSWVNEITPLNQPSQCGNRDGAAYSTDTAPPAPPTEYGTSGGEIAPYNPGPTDVTDAGAAMAMYAGGEDKRPGGGPPPCAAAGCAAASFTSTRKPAAPRLDLLQWFDEHIRNAEQGARDAALGRSDPLPYPRETLIRTGPAAGSMAETAVVTDAAVCLVTQCSLDRLERLEALLASWDGELSAAVFVDAAPSSTEAASARRSILATCVRARASRAARLAADDQQVAPLLRSAPLWTVTALFRVNDEAVRCEAYDRMYPVNALRNAALDAARAALVFLLDVDFVPSRGLYSRLVGRDGGQRLLRALGGKGSAAAASPVALVVPAFEAARWNVDLPRVEPALRAAHEAGDVEAFHVGHFPKGHRATDFERWFAGAQAASVSLPGRWVSAAHGVDAYPVAYEEHFEPYVVAARARVPRYAERFRGYGLNKISHLYEMYMRGFLFLVVDHRDSFVVAGRHPKSQSWQACVGPEAEAEQRARIASHYATFKAELAAKCGGSPGTSTGAVRQLSWCPGRHVHAPFTMPQVAATQEWQAVVAPDQALLATSWPDAALPELAVSA